MTATYFDPLNDLCPKCMKHYLANPHLVESCASVGIEFGKSTGMMLAEYFSAFHDGRHRGLA